MSPQIGHSDQLEISVPSTTYIEGLHIDTIIVPVSTRVNYTKLPWRPLTIITMVTIDHYKYRLDH